MHIDSKEQALYQLLNEMLFLEEQLKETDIYYYTIGRNINGFDVETSLFEVMMTILNDYKNIVLKDFEEGLD